MAFARALRNGLSMAHCKTLCDVNKLPLLNAQRNFSLSQLRLDKQPNLDLIKVDGLSKIALVIEGKYKTMKDVPPFLPYGTVYKARDKFRLKASIGTSIFLTLLMLYSIRRNQNAKKVQEYEMYLEMEKDAASKK